MGIPTDLQSGEPMEEEPIKSTPPPSSKPEPKEEKKLEEVLTETQRKAEAEKALGNQFYT